MAMGESRMRCWRGIAVAWARALGPAAALTSALLVGFAGLAADPGALIVDGEHSWVDEGHGTVARPIGNDLTGLFLPRHLWQGEHWRRSGSIPRWDPRGFAGRPNVGNPQAGLWYPPTWLAWSWGGPAAPGWLTVAHLLWAGSGAFALGRALGLGRVASTASGAILMLNPYVIAQVHEGHLPHAWSASWYPWAFLGAVLLGRGRRLGWLMLSGSLALSLLAGHPQEGVYLAAALGIWAVADAARGAAARLGHRPAASSRSDVASRAPRSHAGSLGIALVLAAGLAAVEWVPVVMVRPWVAGPLGGEGGGGSSRYCLVASNLLQLVSPRALGGPADFFGRGNQWETLLSIGWAPLVLAVIGVAGSPDRRAVLGWSALLLLSLIHASGEALGLVAIVADLPGMGGARVPARSLFLAATAAAMLAGMGVDSITRTVDREQTGRRFRRYAALVGLLSLLLAIGVAADQSGVFGMEGGAIRPGKRWAMACSRITRDGITAASMAATGAALAWSARWAASGRLAAMAIGFVAIAELAASAAVALPVCPPGRFLGTDAVSEAIGRVRPARPFRVRAQDAFYSDLDAWRDGIEKTNLGDLFQLRHAAEVYRELYPIFEEPEPGRRRPLDPEMARAALDRLGVALVVGDRPLRVEVGPVVASGRRGETRFSVVANPRAMPRAYVVPAAEVVGEGSMFDGLAEVDPQTAVLMSGDPLRGVAGPRQPFKAASYESSDPDRVAVRVSTEAPGLLVVADAWMPGWSATLNGRPAPVLRGDYAFRVVPLPMPGPHEVVMTYRAPGLAIGVAISAGAAILSVSLALGRRPRWRGGHPRSSRSVGP